MSIKALNHVLEHSKQRATRLLCMIAVANAANDDGFAWLKIKNIAKHARSDARNASRYLRACETEGELVVYERRTDDGEQQMSNLYKVVMPGNEHADPPEIRGLIAPAPRPKKVANLPGGGGKSTGGGGGKSTGGVVVNLPPYDPSLDPTSKDPKDSEPSGSGRAPRERDVVFDAVAIHIFGIEDAGAEGGRIAKISNWLKGAYEGKGKERVGKLSKPAEVIHIELFAAYCRHEGFTPPLDFVKFVEQWRKWSTIIRAQSAGAGKKVMTLEEYEQLLEEEGQDAR